MIRTIVGGALAGAALIGVIGAADIVIYQPTKSLPRGLYVRTFEPAEVGSVITFPVPKSIAGQLRMPYSRLMKPVIAGKGDTVCLTDGMLTVNGTPFAPVSKRLARPDWSGCRTLSDNEVAVGSARIPDSLDSRLYGTVSKSGARTYRPLLVECERCGL